MTSRLRQRAGTALIWRASQLGLGQVISLVRILVLARLLAPDDFGLMAIAAVCVHTLLQLTDFGIVPALMQRADVEERHYDAGWTLGLIRAATVAAFILAMSPVIAQLFGEPQSTPIIRALALRPVLEALSSIKIAALGRAFQFRSLAVIGLSGVVADALTAIGLAKLLGVWALVAGVLAGSGVSMVASYWLAPHRPRLRFDWEAARPLVQFGRWMLLAGVLAVSGSTVLQLVISRQLGAASLGLYYLAVRLAFLPSEVAQKIVGEVAFPVYARLQNDSASMTRAFQSIFVGMSAVLVPAYSLLIALAPAIVDEVMGPRWQGTARLIRILAAAGILSLFAEALGPAFKGVGRPANVTVIEGMQSVALVLAVWPLVESWRLEGAAMAWLPGVLVAQIAAVVLSRRLLLRFSASFWRALFAIVLVTALGAATAVGLAGAIVGLPGLFVSGLVSLTLMLWLMLRVDARLRLGLMGDLVHAYPQLAPVAGLLQRWER